MLEQVHNDTNSALKAGDKKTAEALRLLYSALKNAQIEAGGALADERAIQVIKKEMKKRVEARDIYAANGREELAAKEEFERTLYSRYAPADLSAQQIDELITRIAATVPEKTFASIMSMVMKEAKGSADGRLVSERVKHYLENNA